MVDEDKEEKRGFKVQDRRRFSESGDARPEVSTDPQSEAQQASETIVDRGPVQAAAAVDESTPHDAPFMELNFSTFLLSLSTQALAHLGEIPDPVSHRVDIDLGAAKQMIDILGLLQEKTKGNLDQAESRLLDGVLYDLRLRYVERARRTQPT